MYDTRAVTAHFITHWGVPKEIRPRKVRGIEAFAILEFAPARPSLGWLYATNGMGSYVQANSDRNIKVRTELYAHASTRVVWVDDLLSAIATYPMGYNTFLAEGDTINVGQPIDRKKSCYTGILLAPPNPATLGLVGGVSENILVHQVIGVLDNEMDYAKQHSGRMLWERIMAKGATFIDDERESAV